MSIENALKLPENRIRKKLEDTFDYNYSMSEINISTIEEFNENLYLPFINNEKIYYRGERINSPARPLIPTLLRDTDCFRPDYDDGIVYINSKKLYSFYRSKTNFINVYNTVNGDFDINSMYKMMAFAQHYLNVSPLIDFSKNLFVALSFALKNKTSFDEDPIIYTVYDIGDDDTTSDINEVNEWLNNYHVAILDETLLEAFKTKALNIKKPEALEIAKYKASEMANAVKIVNHMYPTAKLIDIPTNDLMKYQQGVFLLLNNFTIVSFKYLTKSVRKSFIVKKYVLNKEICPYLQGFLQEKAPHYKYNCLLSIAKAVK